MTTTFEPLDGPVSPDHYPTGRDGIAALPDPLAAPTPDGAELVTTYTVDKASRDQAQQLIDGWLAGLELPTGRWMPQEFAHHVRTREGADLLVVDYMHPGIWPDRYTIMLNHEAGRGAKDQDGGQGIAVDRHVVAMPEMLPRWLVPIEG